MSDLEATEITLKVQQTIDQIEEIETESADIVEDGIVTTEMIQTELELSKRTEDEEIKHFDQEQRDQLKKRLNFLVEKAGVYSSWLASRLEERQKEISKKEYLAKVDAKEKKPIPTDKDATIPVTIKKTRKTAKRKQPPEIQYEEKKLKLDLVRTGRQPALVTGVEMREYQLVGMEWLISLYDNGLNGILGDEMGLGKTLQTIAFLAHLREMGTAGPFLIVAPLSTVSNWIAEMERFTPQVPVVLYHGSPQERASIRNRKLKFNNPNFPIVVTSYEICMNDRKYLQNIAWKYIVVDEGHRLKNLNCRLIRELKSYHSANRLLLTGTPLQNNLAELWSLLNFLMPDIFDDLSVFEQWFEFAKEDLNQEDIDAQMVAKLHAILKPFLLRRVKTEVAVDLPLKREYLLYAPLSAKQRELYEAALKGKLIAAITANLLNPTVGYKEDEDEEKEKEKENISGRRSNTLNDDKTKKTDLYISKIVGSQKLQSLIIQLRKVCNHPYLFNISNEEITQNDEDQGESIPEIIRWSGKMMILDKLLPALLDKGHKVIIFSQMTKMLDVIADYLEFLKKIDYCRIDGAIKMEDRRRQINEFNNDPNMKVFLLSTRAGGLGINLTSADTVIIYDSDWNPQADLQAQDRVHRIGQTKPVIVYRFVTNGTVERNILDKASGKRKLERLVIHKGQFKGSKGYYQSNSSINANELRDILNIQEVQDVQTEELTSDDLENIMDRSPEAYKKVDTSSKFAVLEEVPNKFLA